MLAEKWMFQRIRLRKGGTTKDMAPLEPEAGGASDSESSSGGESDGEQATTGKTAPKKICRTGAVKVDLNNGLVWGKNVDPSYENTFRLSRAKVRWLPSTSITHLGLVRFCLSISAHEIAYFLHSTHRTVLRQPRSDGRKTTRES
jgi:hypothetical protein